MTTTDGLANSLFDESRSNIEATEFGSSARACEIAILGIASSRHATITNFFIAKLIPD